MDIIKVKEYNKAIRQHNKVAKKLNTIARKKYLLSDNCALLVNGKEYNKKTSEEKALETRCCDDEILVLQSELDVLKKKVDDLRVEVDASMTPEESRKQAEIEVKRELRSGGSLMRY